jgi:hypothetical protein
MGVKKKKETGCEDVYWIHLDQDGIQWWDVVNMVLTLQVQ